MSEEHFQRIVDDLAELKDTSELMLDLAYSSILLNSKELAKEVQELEGHMDNLHTEFEFLVLSSGFKPEESKDYLGLIRLGMITEMIADAATKIAQVVLRELEPHAILRMAIREAEETVTVAQVLQGSPLDGKTLREARIPEETGMWILAIRRGKSCIRPKPDTQIMVGDILIASGYAEGEEDFKKMASGSAEQEEIIDWF